MSTWDRRSTPTVSPLRRADPAGRPVAGRIGSAACWEGRSGVPHIGPTYLHAGHRSYRRRMPDRPSSLGSPEDARAQLRGYVRALHHAYLGGAGLLAPGDRAALPLLAATRVTVIVVAARHLHLIAVTDQLPPPTGQEVAEPDELEGMRWVVRYYDPVVLPVLGMIGETEGADPAAVRRVLGISGVLYHLSVTPGGGLTAHHAQHAGTALVNEHAAAARDGESLRALLPGRAGWASPRAARTGSCTRWRRKACLSGSRTPVHTGSASPCRFSEPVLRRPLACTARPPRRSTSCGPSPARPCTWLCWTGSRPATSSAGRVPVRCGCSAGSGTGARPPPPPLARCGSLSSRPLSLTSA